MALALALVTDGLEAPRFGTGRPPDPMTFDGAPIGVPGGVAGGWFKFGIIGMGKPMEDPPPTAPPDPGKGEFEEAEPSRGLRPAPTNGDGTGEE